MPYKIAKVDVWAADIMNRPGMLARVLEALTNAGAQLEFMVARRASETTSRVFVAPLKGKKQVQAATDVGLVPAKGMHALRVDGPDRPGLAANLTRALADQSINLRGASAAAMAKKCVIYFGFGSADDAKNAARVLKKALSAKRA